MSLAPPNAVPCPDIGKGWYLDTVPRKSGNHAGDRYWYSPCGKRFRSRPEVDRFLKSQIKSKDTASRLKHEVGKVIYKKFPVEGSDAIKKEFVGTIECYDQRRKLYKVVYEDDDEEELSEGEIDELIKRKRNERRNEKRKKARVAQTAKANSPSSGSSNKRKSTDDNPYKRRYNNLKKSPTTTELVSKSNKRSKSTTRTSHANDLTPPIRNIPPEEMRAAIIENRLPTGLTLPQSSRNSNQTKITIKTAAQNRLDAAKRWVASAALNVESAKHQLEAALKARHEALNEQLEAQTFLEQVNSISNEASIKRTQQPKLSVTLDNNVKDTETNAMFPFLAKPSDESFKIESSKRNEGVMLNRRLKTGLLFPDGDLTREQRSKTSLPTPSEESAPKSRQEYNSSTDASNCNGTNDIKDDLAVTAHQEQSDDVDNASSTESCAMSSKAEAIEDRNGQRQQTNTLPLKKRPSYKKSSDSSEDENDESIIHLKTVQPSSKRNRRFDDLTPAAQEVLRKTVLSSLSNNGEVDPVDMKRATDTGIPEQSVLDAVKLAWGRLRSKAIDVAKGKMKMLNGIEFKGFDVSEFDGLYELCLEERRSNADPNSESYLPPSFEKRHIHNGKTAVFRLYYIGSSYKEDPSKWEIMCSEKLQDEDGRAVIRYKGSISRPKSNAETVSSFTKTWVSSVGEECEVTVTPLYI